eukprot:697198-Rhodomonas_salina.2
MLEGRSQVKLWIQRLTAIIFLDKYASKLCSVLTIHDSATGNPKRRQPKKQAIALLPMSKPTSGPDVSIRKAFSLFAPNATICAGLTKDMIRVGAKYIVQTASQPVRRSRRVTTTSNCGFVSAFHEQCPKNQRQTRASPRAA